MAEPLTFLFRFQDDGSSPAGANTAPVGARGGQAAAAMPAQPPRPRRRRSTPNGASQPRARTSAQPAQPASGERRPQAERSRRPTRHAASEVFDELVRAVRRIPGPIGKTVGLINDLAEPFARARRRYRELLEAHSEREGRRERGAGRESRQPPDTRPSPRASRLQAATPPQRPSRRRGGASTAGGQNQSPRQPGRATAASSPASGQPRQRTNGNAPQRGQALQNPPRAPIPSSLSPERQALQRLIDALGPLPESQRELIAALRPLRDLGYKSKDLREGLRDRRERLRADAQEAGQQQPNAAQRHRRRVRRQQLARQPARRPAQPGRATQVARSTGQAAQQGGAAAGDAAGQAVGRGAAAGAMEGAGMSALAGGLMVGLGAVAAIGAAAVAFDALVSTVKKLDSLFVGLGQKLAPFNGRLAAANAINNAKNTISDITSARAIGDKLARYTNARGDSGRALQRILDVLEGLALDAITPILEKVPDILTQMLEVLLTIKEFIKNFDPWSNIGDQLMTAAKTAVKQVEDMLKRQQQTKDLLSLNGMFNGGLADLIVEGLNFGSGQKPAQPPGMRVGPIPPVGIGGI